MKTKRQPWQAGMVAVLTAIATGVLGCSVEEPIHSVNALEDDTGDRVYLALSDEADPNDPSSYRIAANLPTGVEASALRICLTDAATCQADATAGIPAAQMRTTTINGKRFAYTSGFVRLSDNMRITAVAGSGASAFVTSVQLTPVSNPATLPAEPVQPAQPAQPESPCYKAPDEFTCQVELEIFRLTNDKRAQSSRGALEFDPKLSFVSRLWSAEQARLGSISHAWFSNGRLRQEYIKEFGVQPRLGGENVAMNGGLNSSNATAVAQVFVNMWWNSSGHRQNMLGGFKSLAVGVARRGNAWYATQNFGN